MTTDEPVYRIKRLVWERDEATGWLGAHTVFGYVRIMRSSMSHNPSIDWRAYCNGDLIRPVKSESEQAAQLAAQAWHDERMLLGLEVVE